MPFDIDRWLTENPAPHEPGQNGYGGQNGALANGQPRKKGRPRRNPLGFRKNETIEDFRLRRASNWLRKVDSAISHMDGHSKTYWVARGLVWDFDLPMDQARHLIHEWNQTCDPPWTEGELEHKLSDADAKADYKGRPRGWKFEEERRLYRPPLAPQAPADANGKPQDDRLPQIILSPREDEVTEAAIAALYSEPDVFQRPSGLVTIIRDPSKSMGIIRPAGSPRIVPIPPARVRGMLTRVADIVKVRLDEDGVEQLVPTHPPEWLVPQIMARGQWGDIPILESVVESPVLRKDGTILSQPGYDDRSALLFEPKEDFLPVESRPTLDDAENARDRLYDLVCDFPFVNDLHRAAWLAALLTPFARFAIDGPCPMFLFDANTSSAGKTLLCDMISIIVCGRGMPRMTYTDDDDEMRKRITSLALSGDRMALLDNVAKEFGGQAIDAALTGLLWKDRLFYKQEMSAEIPLYTVWYATGNNVTFTGDVGRRAIPCRLKSDEDNPEQGREYRYERIMAHAADQRVGYVRDALTILRGFIANNPNHRDKKPLGTYESWCDIIRSAVQWVTGHDPVETQREFKEADQRMNDQIALVVGWSELPGAREEIGLTAAQALGYLDGNPYAYETLRELLTANSTSEKRRYVSPRVLGRMLSPLRDKVFRGMRLVATPYQGTFHWRIEVVGEGGGNQDGATQEEGGAAFDSPPF